MNTLDPALAKYLSSSKQDIYNAYHGKMKKKKRKHDEQLQQPVAGTSSGLIINGDGDDDVWGVYGSKKGNGDDDDEDDGVPVVHQRASSSFKPIASSSAAPSQAQPDKEAIPADEAPLVVGDVVQEAPTAGSAFAQKRLQGGLQTAEQLREQNKRRKEAAKAEKEAAARRRKERHGSEEEAGEETVYRDTSGKKVDTKAEKAERARVKRAEMEKEMAKMEWGKGLVQREDREKRQREIEEMANKPMARFADDREMNEEMKDVQRWNDPAANFLENASKKTKSKGMQRPKYSGPAPPPNRFGILPGYRWDGVDRSTGFERELLQAGNKRKVRDAAARVYSTSDM